MIEFLEELKEASADAERERAKIDAKMRYKKHGKQ